MSVAARALIPTMEQFRMVETNPTLREHSAKHSGKQSVCVWRCECCANVEPKRK